MSKRVAPQVQALSYQELKKRDSANREAYDTLHQQFTKLHSEHMALEQSHVTVKQSFETTLHQLGDLKARLEKANNVMFVMEEKMVEVGVDPVTLESLTVDPQVRSSEMSDIDSRLTALEQRVSQRRDRAVFLKESAAALEAFVEQNFDY
jgi:predicted  nucleic acid-binding Zn-ribbon protein